MLTNSAKDASALSEQMTEQTRIEIILPPEKEQLVPFSQYYPRVSVVIPTLNEAQNLPYVLPAIPEWVHEILIVDGLSTDNTIEIAQALRDDVRIVIQEGRGKGAALRSGFEAATGDIIVMMDADGSTDPAEIPLFLGALLAGADFAKGSRFLQGGGTSDMEFHRKLGNWGLTTSVRLLFGCSYTDLCYGYNAFWRRVVPVLQLDGTGFEIETMMNVRALCTGLKVAEVPSFEHKRIFGKSNLRALPDGWRVLKTLLGEWRKARGRRTPGRLGPEAAGGVLAGIAAFLNPGGTGEQGIFE